jgi:N-acetylmuramic acid 6-phosphate etherase
MTNLMTRNEKLRQRALGILMAECSLDQDEARSLLEATNWDLRVAIVMRKTGADRDEAERALLQTNFAISRAIELIENSAN